MGVEIERKFLVIRELFPEPAGGVEVKQGYLPTKGPVTVRVRLKGEKGFLTVKGPSTDDGLIRSEFEYPIPAADAEGMLDELCAGRTVEKVRYEVSHGGRLWEIDVFSGANEGLMMAEVELEDAEEAVEAPAWAGREVTGDPRFYNRMLAENPWQEWSAGFPEENPGD